MEISTKNRFPMNLNFPDFLTPQERVIAGSTERGIVGSAGWYTPVSIDLSNPETLTKAIRVRGRDMFFIAAGAGYSLGLKNELAVSVEKINRKTGLTVADPRVLGEFNSSWETLRLIEDPYINEELYKLWEKYDIQIGRRDKYHLHFRGKIS